MGESIDLFVLHKGEFEQYEAMVEGHEGTYYDRLQELLITSLAQGLTTEREP